MKEKSPITLKDHSKVVVVGGGPAGAFFAIHLLREAKRTHRELEVVIVEKKLMASPDGAPWERRGCNFCAGGISPRLSDILDQDGLSLPSEVIQGEIDTIWIQGLWKNFPLRVPRGMKMFTVFRGTLPSKRERNIDGFDAFLLEKAVQEGAIVVSGEVTAIDYTADRLPRLTLENRSNPPSFMEADFVTLSTGINSRCDKGTQENSLTRSIRKIIPGFIPAEARRALIFELELGTDYLKKYLNREVYFIEYGSKELDLEHISLVPKGHYLTAMLIGKTIDRAVLPEESKQIIHDFLSMPHIKRILPDVADQSAACVCFPSITTGPAKNPFADRLAFVGDAVGSRLYKDGLYSAYRSGRGLAKTLLTHGIDKTSLEREYGKVVRWLSEDNRYGQKVFGLIGFAFSTPLLSRILYQAFATELKIRDDSKRPLSRVLWKVASGFSDYREVYKDLCSLSVFRSVFVGGLLVTLRNLSTELFFGLKWGDFSSYPTVVIKEKRNYIKDSLAATLGITLDESPDFERMYALKIRTPAERIFAELGHFGEEIRSYLKLRFVDVKRVKGEANQLDSVVQYRLRLTPLAMRMWVKQVVPGQAILYEVEDKYTTRGKLIFQINPTRDGNSRFVIYTAFDFKRGERFVTWAIWKIFKMLFPKFSHDVVWNHALCNIKEEVERTGRS